MACDTRCGELVPTGDNAKILVHLRAGMMNARRDGMLDDAMLEILIDKTLKVRAYVFMSRHARRSANMRSCVRTAARPTYR